MQGIPFDIPESLGSYVTQFRNDPGKGITNLETHLKKRGLDAVGYFLLAWMYHLNGQTELSLNHSMKAKCCAPGSPFFENLHYYMVHPRKFEAWQPEEGTVTDYPVEEPEDDTVYPLDLDQLIEDLSDAETKKITVDTDTETVEKDDRDLGEKAKQVGDIASETLAMIYEKQKKYDEAIQTLKRLCQVKPGKKDHYLAEIARLEKRIASDTV